MTNVRRFRIPAVHSLKHHPCRLRETVRELPAAAKNKKFQRQASSDPSVAVQAILAYSRLSAGPRY